MNQMQGCGWPLSAPPGGQIDFRTSTAAPTFSVHYIAFANKPRHLVDAASINASEELIEIPLAQPTTYPGHLANVIPSPEVGCWDAAEWPITFSLQIPPTWRSGIYAAKCVDALGSIFYIPFIVTPGSAARSDIAVLANVNTWNAYNNWGGYSRYEPPPSKIASCTTSFLRPNPSATPVEVDDEPFRQDVEARAALLQSQPRPADYGMAYECRHLVRAELWVLNWLQEAGYAVDVWSDLDFHAGIPNFGQYKALILSTHPEYWSTQMLDHLEAYLGAEGSLLYLGGNGIFDCVEISPDGTAMTSHGTQNVRDRLFTQINRPQAAVLGIAYDKDDSFTLTREPYQVKAAHPMVFLGTGLEVGKRFGKRGWSIPPGGQDLKQGAASGLECDSKRPASPPGVQILASRAGTDTVPGDMSLIDHQPAGRGLVFSVGSITFGGSLVVDRTLQRIVRNVLDMCLHPIDLYSHGVPGILAWIIDGVLAILPSGHLVRVPPREPLNGMEMAGVVKALTRLAADATSREVLERAAREISMSK